MFKYATCFSIICIFLFDMSLKNAIKTAWFVKTGFNETIIVPIIISGIFLTKKYNNVLCLFILWKYIIKKLYKHFTLFKHKLLNDIILIKKVCITSLDHIQDLRSQELRSVISCCKYSHCHNIHNHYHYNFIINNVLESKIYILFNKHGLGKLNIFHGGCASTQSFQWGLRHKDTHAVDAYVNVDETEKTSMFTNHCKI